MKRPMIKVTRLLVFMALCCALLVGNFFIPSPVAEAATKKTAISATKLTIPVGTIDSKVYWNLSSIWEIESAQKLTVTNKLKGATYKFTSSNTKVVKINSDGGYLTGLQAGSATITCTQTYNKKSTTIGKCTVSVKNAAFIVNDDYNTFPIGSDGFDLYDHYSYGEEPLFDIAYRNPNATYTLTSSDSKNFTIKEVKYDASKAKELTKDEFGQEMLVSHIGKRYFYGYQFTAKKAGTYKVTVKETYNKKTKTLGSIKVVIKDTSITDEKQDMLLGNTMNVFDLLQYTKAINYYFEIQDYDESNEDNNVLLLNKDGEDLYLYANKTGTAQVTVKEKSKDGTVIGTVTINVAEAPCESIIVDEEYTTYVDDEFYIYYELEPYDTTDKVTIESDNSKVLKVEFDEEEQYWKYTPLKAGTANVTIKCGDQTAVTKVIVEEW